MHASLLGDLEEKEEGKDIGACVCVGGVFSPPFLSMEDVKGSVIK